MDEYKKLRRTIRVAVRQNTEASAEAIDKITNQVMDVISENYRSISEVHDIVETVRGGKNVQIAYWDPDEEDDEFTVRACW